MPNAFLRSATTQFFAKIFRKEFLTLESLKPTGSGIKNSPGVMMKTGETYDPNAQSLRGRFDGSRDPYPPCTGTRRSPRSIQR